jgi:curli biogenesis system outer membrane secretion channel CsgG
MSRNVCAVVVVLASLAFGPGLGAGSAFAQAPAAKPRIAVVAFKNPTSWWGRELGSSAASQLTTKLVNSGAFTVLERERTKDIFDEWYLGQSGAVDQSQAAQMGKLNGVEYLVTGEFKSFNIRQRRVGGLPLPGTNRQLGGSQTRAESDLNVRVINVVTGEIIAASEGKGETVLGQGASAGGLNYGEISTSSPWNPTVAEQALGPALDKIAADIVAQKGRMPTSAPAASTQTAKPSAPSIAGVAADGSNKNAKGQNANMSVGRRFHVLRVVDVIKDGKGNVLDNVTKRVGVIEVTQVLARSAICKVVDGAKPADKDLLEPAN